MERIWNLLWAASLRTDAAQRILDHSMRLLVSLNNRQRTIGSRDQKTKAGRARMRVRGRFGRPFSRFLFPCYLAILLLPGSVGGAVDGSLLGAAVDVVDAGFGLVEAHEGVLLGGNPGVGTGGEGIDGHHFNITRLDEVIEGLGGFLLVDGVGVDGLAEDVKVFFEDGLFGVADVAGIGGYGGGGEQADDDHDNHEFDQGEARSAGSRGQGVGSRRQRLVYRMG